MIKLLSQKDLDRVKVKASDILINDQEKKDFAELIFSLVKTIEDLRESLLIKEAFSDIAMNFIGSAGKLEEFKEFINQGNNVVENSEV
jgi:hypothetical protein